MAYQNWMTRASNPVKEDSANSSTTFHLQENLNPVLGSLAFTTSQNHVNEGSASFSTVHQHQIPVINSPEDLETNTMSVWCSLSSSSFHSFCFLVHNPIFCIARQPVVDTLPPIDLGPMNISCPFCGALHWADECVSLSRVGHISNVLRPR